ncbi:MAG: DUF2085 domain-containing protein [Candidatus Bathyarchaeia archaeon]|nr:DUF2085 domain-containing protein [Candidatus Bathyarchaeota archaeon]
MKKAIDWDLLFSHSHWITINFNDKQIKLCARCFGTIIGFSVISLLLSLVTYTFSLNFLFICFILAIPGIMDWLTQSWKLRKGRNDLRIITGFTNGSAIALLSFISVPSILKLEIILCILTLILTLGLIGKTVKKTS